MLFRLISHKGKEGIERKDNSNDFKPILLKYCTLDQSIEPINDPM